ncbi:DUF3644 domain-containing protein [Streptomyces sp. PRh5]|uniref:DUF3644 domain-containing protein n=1 Tax=Streptomyces sp. PRh5 TaxID=1158056 RepID=UPI0004B27F83|nr:DUF3644 domain-containing protein [Streptomyces sp. PRh5]
MTGGKAQALVMNYEQEMVDHFGPSFSLADRLRFPIALQTLTAEGREQLQDAAKKLPKKTRYLVAKFEAAIDSDVLDDLKYDYRVRLVPIVGKKTDTDPAVNFVNLDELTDDERAVMTKAGRTGTVITKVKHVETMNPAKLRASDVAKRAGPSCLSTSVSMAITPRCGGGSTFAPPPMLPIRASPSPNIASTTSRSVSICTPTPG